ncbi:putative nepenthesin [Medicago truncatula]|nr:putative nepenthesin [Medicago truncatula]
MLLLLFHLLWSKSSIGREDHYFLTLEAFSVGNNRIEYGEGTNVSMKNIVIDSGTPLTMLPPPFHSKLESYVAKEVKLPCVEPPDHRLSLCYNTTGNQSNFPVITAHFSGADVKLNSNSTFFPIEEGIMCFSFLLSNVKITLLLGFISSHFHLHVRRN